MDEKVAFHNISAPKNMAISNSENLSIEHSSTQTQVLSWSNGLFSCSLVALYYVC